MSPRTIATINDLQKAAWFSRVGAQDTTTAIVLSSWQEAMEHCASLEWENLCLEASNQFRERILERSKERFNKWNEIAAEVKKHTVPFVRQKIADTVRQHNLTK